MALVVNKKRDAGGGWYIVELGTDNVDSLTNTQRLRIIEIRINKHAFNALGANGKTDLTSTITWNSWDLAPFT